jgi:Tol biopolymer transport system component
VRQLEPVTLRTLSLASGSITNFPVAEKFSVDPVYSPNGSQLATVSKTGDQPTLVIYDLRTKQRHVMEVASLLADVAWSPDATRLSYLAVDPASGNHDLMVMDIATSHSRKIANIYQSSTYRWRNDGKAIDVLQGKVATGRNLPEVHRITMSGVRSVIRVLPNPDNDNHGPIRLTSDSVVLVGMKDRLLAVPLPAGEARAVYSGSWSSPAKNALSPDGKWIAFEIGAADGHSAQVAVASLDGKTVRKLGLSQGCDAMPAEWLPDGRALIAWGVDRCNDWREDKYLVPLDGGPAQALALPANESYTLTPDGKQLLIAADDPKIGSIIAFDISKLLAHPVQAGRPGKP